MKYVSILLLTLFVSCSPQTVRMIDDVIEGEAKVIEQAVNDEIGQPAAMKRPEVTQIQPGLKMKVFEW